MAATDFPLVAAVAMARGRARVVRRRIWPSALGDRRRAADIPGVLLGVDRSGLIYPLWIHPVLLVAGGRRSNTDAEIRADGACGCSRSGALARTQRSNRVVRSEEHT